MNKPNKHQLLLHIYW